LLYYVGRFFFLISTEIPLYFPQKRRYGSTVKQVVSELANFDFIYVMATLNVHAMFILPLVVMRIGLMVGN